MLTSIVAIPVILLTIVLNIVQLWCLRKHFRRHVNHLMVTIYHLSVADLVQGLAAIPSFIFTVLRTRLFPGSHLLHEFIDACVQVNRYLSAVSIVTLATLTALKMLRVIRNEWLTRRTIKRICRTIWIVVFVCFFAEYVVYKAHGYSGDVELVKKYRRFWLSALVLPAIVIFMFCFARMFYVMKTRMIQTSPKPDGHKRRFLVISVLNLVAFIVCAAPLAVLNVLDVMIRINPHKVMKLHPILRTFLLINPLVDSVGFLIVYRRKLRPQGPQGGPRRSMELRTVHKRPVERMIRDQERGVNHS